MATEWDAETAIASCVCRGNNIGILAGVQTLAAIPAPQRGGRPEFISETEVFPGTAGPVLRKPSKTTASLAPTSCIQL